MIKSSKKGFTLVELIVVIVILATLATIGFISLQDYSKNARDSKRSSDLASLSKKATIVIVEGAKHTDFINGTETDAATIPSISNYDVTAKYGDINFATLKESADSFKAPKGKKYLAAYVSATPTTAGLAADDTLKPFSCFEFAALTETTGVIETNGNCGGYNVTGNSLFPTTDAAYE